MKELNKDDNLSITGGYFPSDRRTVGKVESYRKNYHLLVK